MLRLLRSYRRFARREREERAEQPAAAMRIVFKGSRKAALRRERGLKGSGNRKEKDCRSLIAKDNPDRRTP